ncbi:hypothetical protein OF83DRAFT_1283822 [Amylostereum chailletii]|nr:hypothetical protein OF83DRAFT_1283822 [Amylostereum chailletii]
MFRANVLALLLALFSSFILLSSSAPVRYTPMRRATNATQCNSDSLQLLNDLLTAQKQMNDVAAKADTSEVQTIQGSVQNAMNSLFSITNSMSSGSAVDPAVGDAMSANITLARNTIDSVIAPDAVTANTLSDAVFTLIDAIQSGDKVVSDCIGA